MNIWIKIKGFLLLRKINKHFNSTKMSNNELGGVVVFFKTKTLM